jgi:hypothetical protein
MSSSLIKYSNGLLKKFSPNCWYFSSLENTSQRNGKVFNNCRVNRGTSDEEIKDAIYHMSETYFTKLDTEYTFIHDFIFETIAYHYGRQNQNGRQSKMLNIPTFP